MVSRLDRAKKWPRRKSGEILFNTTNEAIIYAHLIFDDKPLVDEMQQSLYAARDELAILAGRENHDLDIHMQVAVKAQIFRECLEEVVRIMVEE